MRGALLSVLVLCLAGVSAAARAESLIDFYRAALETNPAVRTREFGIDQARAQKAQVKSKLLPQVVATGNYGWNNYDETGRPAQKYDGIRAGVQARQALFDLASYFKLQSADFAVAESEKQQEAARMAVAGEVVDRYLTVLQADDEIEQLLVESTAVESQLDRLRFMRSRELVKVTDLYEVEAYQQGLKTRQIEAGAARAVALERLRETTGVSAEGVSALARENFPEVPGEQSQWLHDAVHGNPNLVALQNAIQAAAKLIKSSYAEHAPQVALTSSWSYSDQGFDNRLVPKYNVGTVGLQVVVPIYEGGSTQATVNEAVARHGMALEQFEAARREVERDVRTAYLGAVTGYARISSTNDEVRAVLKVLESQQKSYDLGASTIVDVLIAQRALFKSRTEQYKARYDYIRALIELRIRAGALREDDIQELDAWLDGRQRASDVGAAVGAQTAADFRQP